MKTEARDVGLEQYVARFGYPPMLQMDHLSDAEFSARIAKALEEGRAIEAEEFEVDLAEGETAY